MSSPGFYLYTRDFRDGVKRLKEDEVGVYVLFLSVLYETEHGRIRDDDAEIAADIGRDVRVWRRVKKRLLELGKLTSRDGWLRNPKADVEIAKRQRVSEQRSEAGRAGGEASGRSRRGKAKTEDAPDFSETSGEDQPNFWEKSGTSSADLPENVKAKTNEINGHDEALASLRARDSLALAINTTLHCARDARGLKGILDAEFEEPGPEPPAAAESPQPSADAQSVAALLAACADAAGPGLTADRRVLFDTIDVVQRALADGCDLEADILPVIRGRTTRQRTHAIATFRYFEPAWLEARDARRNPKPLAPETAHERADEVQGGRTAGAPRQDRTRVAREAKAVGRAGGGGGLVGAALRARARRQDLDERSGAEGLCAAGVDDGPERARQLVIAAA